MKIGAFILALVGPLLSRILAALGMSLITITGLTAAVSALKDLMMGGLQGMPLAALQYAGLCGIWSALAVWLAAITFVVTWQATKGFTAVVRS